MAEFSLLPVFIGFLIGYCMIQIMKKVDVILKSIVFWSMTVFKTGRIALKELIQTKRGNVQ